MDNIQQQLNITTPSPEQVLQPHWRNAEHYQLFCKRDDLIHPVMSGNKWRKLKYQLAQKDKPRQIVSFGGGHSNHLHALSHCCRVLQIPFTALVRGDYRHNPSATINDLVANKTNVVYLDKKRFQLRSHPDYVQHLHQQYPGALIIPEGGSHPSAIAGVTEIVSELTQHYDYIVAPVASGGTLAGLITGVRQQKLRTKVLGMAVLKGQGYLEGLVTDLIPAEQATANRDDAPEWQIEHRFHQGGYAKRPAELQDFCQQTSEALAVPLEPVYSGKALFALKQLMAEHFFSKGAKILFLHTGGMQGARSAPSV